MKTLTLDKNSWHGEIAKFGGYEFWYDSADICTYTRAIFSGLFKILLLSLVTIGFGWVLIETLLSIGFSLYYWKNFFSEPGIVGSILIGSLGVVFGVIWLYTKIRNRPSKPDGFIKQAYKAHKEKYCLKLEFVEHV